VRAVDSYLRYNWNSLSDKIVEQLQSKEGLAFSIADAENIRRNQRIYDVIFSILTLGLWWYFGRISEKEWTSRLDKLKKIQSLFCNKNAQKIECVFKKRFQKRMEMLSILQKSYRRCFKPVLTKRSNAAQVIQNAFYPRIRKKLEAKAIVQRFIYGKVKALQKKVQRACRNLETSTQTVFERAKVFCDELKPHYSLFIHGQSLEVAFFQKLFSSLDCAIRPFPKTRQRLSCSKDTNLERVVYGEGIHPPNLLNAEAFHKSPLAEISDRKLSSLIISADGFLENRDRGESAWFFFHQKEAGAQLRTNTRWPKKFAEALALELCPSDLAKQKEIQIKIIEAHSTVASFEASALTVFGVRKSTLLQENKRYVYRSHPYGERCECTHQGAFFKTLEENQQGKASICTLKSGRTYNPQYRILAPNFDKDPHAFAITVPNLSKEQLKSYYKITYELLAQLRVEKHSF